MPGSACGSAVEKVGPVRGGCAGSTRPFPGSRISLKRWPAPEGVTSVPSQTRAGHGVRNPLSPASDLFWWRSLKTRTRCCPVSLTQRWPQTFMGDVPGRAALSASTKVPQRTFATARGWLIFPPCKHRPLTADRMAVVIRANVIIGDASG